MVTYATEGATGKDAPPQDEDKVRFLLDWYERLKGQRSNLERTWQDAADLMLPGYSFNVQHSPGYDGYRKLYDNTAGRMLYLLVGAIHGFLTNPATKWFNMVDDDYDLNGHPPVRRWIDDVVLRMMRFLSSDRVNFNNQAQEVYAGVLAFGTGPMVLNEEPARLRFAARPLSECYLSADSDGNVEAVFRKLMLTNRQCYEMFRGGVHENVVQALERGGKSEERIEVLHAVYPRGSRDPLNYSAKNKPLASCYVDVRNKHLMRESGYDKMPFLTPRFFKAPGEVYGYGPGTMLLADVGMLNEFRRTHIMSQELAVAPPLMVQANGTEGPISTAPLSINYTRQGAVDAIKPMLTGVRPDLGDKALAEMREEIRKGFFLDMFTLPEIDRMTVPEVMARLQQKMVFGSPMISRLTGEFLAPLVERTYDYMRDTRQLPPPPREMQGRSLRIEFQSILAQSQRMGEANAAQQWVNSLAPLAQADPGILDWVDTDELAVVSGTGWYGVPQRLVRTPQVVAQLRAARAQQVQASQQAQTLLAQAQAANQGSQAIANLRPAA